MDTSQTFVVRGQVRYSDGKPFVGVQVRAVDRDLRREQPLGQQTTDDGGRYEIRYQATAFSRAEKASADLVVRVVNAGGQVIAHSSTLFNAPAQATVDLVVAQTAAGTPSEYERIDAALRPLTVDVAPADLDASDLDFLTGETRIPRRKLATFAAAAALERKTRVPAAAFYGMAREGLPATLAGLALAGSTAQTAALRRAVAENLIPASLATSITSIVTQLAQAATSEALQTPGWSGSTVGDLVGGVLSTPAEQIAFLNTWAESRDLPPADVWAKLRAQPALAPKVDALQLALQLSIVTSGNAALVKQLQTTLPIRSTADLLKLDKVAWSRLVDQTGVPASVTGATPAEKAANYVSGIVSLLQAAFPTQTVAQVAATAASIDPATRGNVSRFFANATDFDVRSMPVDRYLADHAGALAGIGDADKPAAVRAVKRLQRLFQISTNAESFTALLDTGLDSAHAIAQVPRKSFVARHGAAFGGDALAEELHQRATAITTRSLHTFALINDAVNGIQPRAITGDGLAPAGSGAIVPFELKTGGGAEKMPQGQVAGDVVTKYLPNYQQLFDTADLCDCEECQSALSPAAYLVDLLHFLETSTPNTAGNTPYDVLVGTWDKQGNPTLQGRRPDLAYLPLTCENTNTTLPYLDLVNEILESYVVLGHADKAAAHDTGGTTAAELDANPQYTNDDAYRTLSQASYPFTLPFNQPIAVARTYLAQLGTSRRDILDAFKKDASDTTMRAVNAEALGITVDEYPIITGAHFDASAVTPPLAAWQAYGYTTNDTSPLSHVQEFLQRTGIAYTDLVALLETRFINPAYPQGDALELFQRIPLSFAALSALVASNFANPDQATLDALAAAGITLAELQAWCAANFAALAKLIVLDSPGAQCDLSVTTLGHLDGTALDDAELGRIHRFIRLWRHVSWSIADLGRALAAFKATDITTTVVDLLAGVLQVQSALSPSKVQPILALYGDIPSDGDDALYRTLFLNKARLQIDETFQPGPDGSVLGDPGARISDHLPALCGAFQISDADLAAIRAHAALADDTSQAPPVYAPLTLPNVSTLYAYVVLAKGLRLHVTDLLSLITLTGSAPFSSPSATNAFITIAGTVQQSGFKVATLDYLVRHISVAPTGLAPQTATILALAKTLRDGLTKITTENALAPDPNGDVTRGELALVFDTTVVDQTVTMIAGTAVYTAPLATLPDALALKDAAANVTGIDPTKLPALVAQKTSYDPATALLRFQGAMTTAEQAALAGASADAAFQASVAALFEQPAAFITGTLAGFLDPADGTAKLCRDIASLDAGLQPVLLDASNAITTDPTVAVATSIEQKFAYMLERLLPYLRDQLSRAFVKQTMAQQLQLDSTLVQWLLESELAALGSPGHIGLEDLRALEMPGLTASYFTTPDLSGAAVTASVPSLAAAPIPAGTASARWDGELLAPNNGEFTLSIAAAGAVSLVLDGVSQDLTQDPQTQRWTTAPISLEAGQFVGLLVQIQNLPANATVELRWQSATTPNATVPPAALYPRAPLDTLTAAYTRLQKSALVLNTFKLTQKEVAYLSHPAGAADFAGFSLGLLPLQRDAGSDAAAPALFDAWLRVAQYTALRKQLPAGTVDLIDVFTAPDAATAQAQLALVTAWDPADIAALATGFALTAAEFHNDVAITRMQVCEALVNRLGVAVAPLLSWAALPADYAMPQTYYDQLYDIAQDIKKTVHGKYDETTWLTVAKPLNDQLRQSQRDALVAYLMARLGMSDANQLFEYFLIDVEMCACMETSRVKQALSSVQLFVQRCLLSLESRSDLPELSVSPAAIDAERWEWMSHYRVWEANREVFLYPENWIVPELRDDKTPFFDDLQSALLQNEITADNVEAAFLSYLTSLDQVARLEVCATYWQDKDPDTGEAVNILHVFARTLQTPRLYFYRQWQNGTTWTPWEAVPLDIEGDHLVPIIWNRRLYLLWPTFTAKASPPPPPAIDTSKVTQVGQAKPYWEIKLVWSEYKQGKWQPKQVTADHLASVRAQKFSIGADTVEDYVFAAHQSEHVFEASIDADDALVVRVFVRYDDINLGDEVVIMGPPYATVGEFRIDGARGDVSVGYVPRISLELEDFPVNPLRGSQVPFTTLADLGNNGFHDYQMWKEVTGTVPPQNQLDLLDPRINANTTYLKGTPSWYRLVYPHQYFPYQLQAPLFYQDARRTYFVTPTLGSEAVVVTPPKGKDNINLGPLATIQIPDPAGPVESFPNVIAVGGSEAPVLGTIAAGTQEIALRSARIDAAPLLRTTGTMSGRALDWSTRPSLKRNSWQVSAVEVSVTDLQFFNHFHPYVDEFMKALNRDGVPGLLTVANQQLTDVTGLFKPYFEANYRPDGNHVDAPYPVEIVDFDPQGAYSVYNWELFFHAAMLIAERLTSNQRYSDAMTWLQYVFNPTDDTPGEDTPARYWKVVPFKTTISERLDDMLQLLASDDAALTAQQLADKKSLVAQYEVINSDPFQPHAIARLRLSAYQKYVFMAYLDNLIAWGDSLFRQDTIEAINQATQLYVMASDLLGPRPQQIPSRGTIAPVTYADIRAKVKNQSLPNPIVAIEDAFPFSTGPGDAGDTTGGLLGAGQALYFCTPQNDKLLGYWDTVADRLFKIRNCMNIEGVVRSLALFEPPIDPGLLVQAAAQGVDLSSVLSDLSAPLPYYRFSYILQKAQEACNEVRSLGSSLLSALEKKDAESLSYLRATQEAGVLSMMEQVKKSQVDEASAQIDALNASRAVAATRYTYYQTLLGVTSPSVPGVGQNVPLVTVPAQPAQNAEGGLPLLQEEQNELDSSHSARDWQAQAAQLEVTANMLAYMPDIEIAAKPMGAGIGTTWGMRNIIAALNAMARSYSDQSAQDSYDAAHSSKMAGYFRRQQEWTNQSNVAAGDIMQIDKQLAAGNIRLAIAQRDLEVHQQQMQNAADVADFLQHKYTNEDLYGWMLSDVSTTYFQAYQMAYDLAKKAELCYRFERGVTSSNFIQFGYWDSLKKGLQSGERLSLALRQLERSYHDQNKRDYEVTKHVSLQLTDPLALITLKQTGRCEVELPESLFDADYPGHYMRRIKSASITMPCVVGPYTSVNCTLTLLSNKTRLTSQLGAQYDEDTQGDDNRFVRNFAAIQAIATSHAQNDSGLFELSFRDERYLPFEGAGAVSRWRIELPIENNAFDLETLSDVILHLKYTARDGGTALKNAARKATQDAISDTDAAPLMRLFSARHEFPDVWYRFTNPVDATVTAQSLPLDLAAERFPYLYRGRALSVSHIDVFLAFKDNSLFAGGAGLAFTLTPDGEPAIAGTLTRSQSLFNGTPYARLDTELGLPGKLTFQVAEADVKKVAPALVQVVPSPDGGHTRLATNAVDDLWIVVHYAVS
jgi:hypothetical protein